MNRLLIRAFGPRRSDVVNLEYQMPHSSDTIHCTGPDSPHAFDNIPLQARNGELDSRCPVCRGYGQWNAEIDLVSFRCIRAICDRCHGAGWIETGDDPVAIPDIVMTPEGQPMWTVRYLDKSEAITGEGDLTRLSG